MANIIVCTWYPKEVPHLAYVLKKSKEKSVSPRDTTENLIYQSHTLHRREKFMQKYILAVLKLCLPNFQITQITGRLTVIETPPSPR